MVRSSISWVRDRSQWTHGLHVGQSGGQLRPHGVGSDAPDLAEVRADEDAADGLGVRDDAEEIRRAGRVRGVAERAPAESSVVAPVEDGLGPAGLTMAGERGGTG